MRVGESMGAGRPSGQGAHVPPVPPPWKKCGWALPTLDFHSLKIAWGRTAQCPS